MVAFTGGAGTVENKGVVYEWSDVVIVTDKNGDIIDYTTQFTGDVLPGSTTAVEIGAFNVQLTSVSYRHLGGTVGASTLTLANGATFLQGANNFTINGKLTNNGSLTATATTILTGAAENNNIMTVGLGNGNQTYVLLKPVSGDFTLSGSGEIRLRDGVLTGQGGESSVTDLFNSTKISGFGLIGSEFGRSGYPTNAGYVALNNTAAGVIEANVSGKTLAIYSQLTQANPVMNAGMMAASNGGTLTLRGYAGAIDGSALYVEQSGAGTLKAYSGSTVVLDSVVLKGGTLDGQGTGVISASGAYTRLVDVDIAANGKVDVAGLITFEGTIENRGKIVQSAFNSQTRIDADDVTLNGGGSFQLFGQYGRSVIVGEAPGAVLTNTNHTIFGVGDIRDGNLSVINSGKISARPDAYRLDDSDVLNIDALAGLTNSGVLEASGKATLVIQSIPGTINNTNGTIQAIGTDAKVSLINLTISGGTLHTNAGNLITTSGVKLNNLATTTTTMIDAGGGTVLEGAIVNKGTIFVDDYNAALLIDDDDVLLTGGGTILLKDNYGTAAILGQQAGAVLTNSNGTIRGDGYIGGSNLTLANAGTIYADADPSEDGIGNLDIKDLASFTNVGSVEARNGAKLHLNNPNDGKIANVGGTIRSDGAGSLVDFGNVVIQGGKIVGANDGTFTVANTTWDGSASKVTASNVNITGGGSLKLKGTIEHSGKIDFYDRSTLVIDANTTLSGGGTVALFDGYVADGAIAASKAGLTLNNVNNTFGGEGDIGANSGLVLTNGSAATITANQLGRTLNINTGNAVVNNGVLSANKGILNVFDNLTGTGRIEITNGGTVIVDQGTDQGVVFVGNSADTLSLSRREAAAGGFDFSIAGVGVGDRIQLDVGLGAGAEIDFAFTFANNITSLASTAFTNGTNPYVINLAGLYSEGQFQFVGGSDNTLGLVRVQSRDGGSGADGLTAAAAGERLVGLDGDDILISGKGNDVLDGSRGLDTADFRQATSSGVTVSLDTTALQAVGGGLGNDRLLNMENLNGSGFADTLTGNALANRIDGGVGADKMSGGLGDDRYYVDNAGDVVVEGKDQGSADIVLASASYTLGAGVYVEFLQTNSASGTAAINLVGNELSQTIVGNAGSNTLTDGGGAGDILKGNGGNDIYRIASAASTIIEGKDEGTADLVLASTSFALGKGVYVEFLQTNSTAGTGAINLVGNELSQTIIGNAGINTLTDGGGAGDVLKGLGGNDIYRVASAATTIVEGKDEGAADIVLASVSFKLNAGAYVEFLQTNSSAGTGAIDLTGNELAQTLVGNAGANRLDGKGGADTLTGRDGKDTFVFSTALNLGVDTITDFKAVDDTIELSKAVFTALSLGTLSTSAFRASTTGLAGDASDRIIYETDTGKLFYDADGTGTGASGIHFATLAGLPTITNADFVVV